MKIRIEFVRRFSNGVMGDGPHFLRSLSGSHARFSKSHGHSSGLRPQHIYPTHEGPQLSFGVASSGCVSGDYYAGNGREGQGKSEKEGSRSRRGLRDCGIQSADWAGNSYLFPFLPSYLQAPAGPPVVIHSSRRRSGGRRRRGSRPRAGRCNPPAPLTAHAHPAIQHKDRVLVVCLASRIAQQLRRGVLGRNLHHHLDQ